MSYSLPRIKICGFTRHQDVHAAAELGIDLYGFNLACGPRRLSLEQALDLVRQLPLWGQAVALFVDATNEQVLQESAACRCPIAQLHGQESPESVAWLAKRMRVIKALRIRQAADLDRIDDYAAAGADAVLLDAYAPHSPGGSGTSWDYRWLKNRRHPCPLILAGGLGPETVAAAVAATGISHVDCASGVEQRPGIKDPQAMAAFVAALRGSLR